MYVTNVCHTCFSSTSHKYAYNKYHEYHIMYIMCIPYIYILCISHIYVHHISHRCVCMCACDSQSVKDLIDFPLTAYFWSR